MMTTTNLYCNHPNKDKIKFIVLPIAREILHTMCDLSINPYELMEIYGEGKKDALGIKFDFSMLFNYGSPELWQIHCLTNKKK